MSKHFYNLRPASLASGLLSTHKLMWLIRIAGFGILYLVMLNAAVAQTFKQTFRVGSFNLPNNLVVSPHPFASTEPGSGLTVARELNGRADVLAPTDAGFQTGMGSGSQFRFSAFGTDVNKFGANFIATGIIPPQFYTAFTIKANLSPGGAISYYNGSGASFFAGDLVPSPAEVASGLKLSRHAITGEYLFSFLNGGAEIILVGGTPVVNWTQINRVEVYTNNLPVPSFYNRCGIPSVMPPLTQHVYVNGVRIVGGAYPIGDLPIGALPPGAPISAFNFIANSAGSDVRLDDIFYSPDFAPAPPMAGAYLVNPSLSESTAFPDFHFAADAVTCRGLVAPVVFVGFGNFEPLKLGNLNNGPIPVIFNGLGATINFCSKTATSTDMITLNGTDNVVVTNFTLNATCAYGTGIRLMNGTETVILSNNIINLPVSGSSSTSASNKGIYATNPGALTIIGNEITGGRRGIVVENATGFLTVGSHVTNGTTVLDELGNRIIDAYEYGISVINADGASFTNNTVRMRPGYGASVAFNGNQLHNFSFDSNLLIGAGRAGIQLNQSNTILGAGTALMVNNRIGQFQASDKNYGVYMYGTKNINLHHNSIGATAALLNYALKAGSATGLDLRNNILVSAAGNPVSAPKSSFSVLTHNNYFNTAGGAIAKFNVVVPTVADLPVSGFSSAGSTQENPGFTVGTDFMTAMRTTNNTLAINATAPLLTGFDFERQARLATLISLGADQFTPVFRIANSSPAAQLSALVHPNPFSAGLTVTLSGAETGQVQVTLTDLTGRQIFTQDYTTEAGHNILPLEIDRQLSHGLYLLQVRQGKATSTFRVIKQ